MATHGWGTDRSVADTLITEGHRFNFYQAVRLLEMMAPERSPVGEGVEADAEAVRFRSDVRLDFPAGDVTRVRPPGPDGAPADMTVNVMGLAGALGPLPAAYTELILERVWKKDTALRDFLDIFNHRLVSLLYRVRKTYRLGFDFASPQRGHIARYLFSLMGMGTGSLQARMGVEDRSLLHYTALLAHRPRSMAGLTYLLADHFGVPVRGVPFRGQWRTIAADQITRLGAGGQNRRLGVNAVLGGRVWDQQGKFEVHLGPMAADTLMDFIPTGSAFAPLCELVRFYSGSELDFDIVLQVSPDDPPARALDARRGPRLGWSAWLGGPRHRMPHQPVRLSPETIDTAYNKER